MTNAITADLGTRTSKLFSALVGLISLDILLQAVWAGVFIREGKDNNDHWVSVHARGADVVIILAIIATIYASAQLRDRNDLLFGSAALAVLLILEAFLGGKIGDHPAVEAVHFPLALGLMGLAVWLPLRARSASDR
jgi:heme A synthase